MAFDYVPSDIISLAPKAQPYTFIIHMPLDLMYIKLLRCSVAFRSALECCGNATRVDVDGVMPNVSRQLSPKSRLRKHLFVSFESFHCHFDQAVLGIAVRE
jgi:hypothetical protein